MTPNPLLWPVRARYSHFLLNNSANTAMWNESIHFLLRTWGRLSVAADLARCPSTPFHQGRFPAPPGGICNPSIDSWVFTHCDSPPYGVALWSWSLCCRGQKEPGSVWKWCKLLLYNCITGTIQLAKYGLYTKQGLAWLMWETRCERLFMTPFILPQTLVLLLHIKLFMCNSV